MPHQQSRCIDSASPGSLNIAREGAPSWAIFTQAAFAFGCNGTIPAILLAMSEHPSNTSNIAIAPRRAIASRQATPRVPLLERGISTGREKGWQGWRAYQPCIQRGNQSAGVVEATFETMIFLQEI